MTFVKCPNCGLENIPCDIRLCPNCNYNIKENVFNIKSEEYLPQSPTPKRRRYNAELNQKRNEVQLPTIDLPEKPKFSVIGLIIDILIFLASIGAFSMKDALSGLICISIGFILFVFLVQEYSKDKERYNLAHTNLEAYKALLSKEKEERIKRDEEDRRIRAAEYKAQQEKLKLLPECPICHSKYNVERISTFSRGASIAVVGLASNKIGKQYRCKKCKHMW